jgi:hypothetical protein
VGQCRFGTHEVVVWMLVVWGGVGSGWVCV